MAAGKQDGNREQKGFMSKVVQHLGNREQELRELAIRERKIRDKWLSFKKRLRANKSLDPDYAEERYRQEEAKFNRHCNRSGI